MALGFLLAFFGSSPARAATPPEEAPFEIPATLKPWAGPGYTVRYFLKIEAPAGPAPADAPPLPELARVFLPLTRPSVKKSDEGESPVERLLVLDDKGEHLPIRAWFMRGGNEAAVAFPVQPGTKAACIYAGAPEAAEVESSPTNYSPNPPLIRLQGFRAHPSFIPEPDKPLTWARFQEMAESAETLGETPVHLVDNPEAPLGLATRVGLQYAAVYDGLLRAPVSGTYAFAVSTFGAAFLQVGGRVVIAAGTLDPDRRPFALTGRIDLPAGVYRFRLCHAQGGNKPGVRLLWKPPGAVSFCLVPPQSFPRTLPALVAAVQDAQGRTRPFIDAERLGQFHTAVHRGPALAHEWVWLFVRGWAPGEGAGRQVRISAPGLDLVSVPAAGGCAWLPAGTALRLELLQADGSPLPGGPVERRPLFPAEAQGALDVVDLTGELLLKAAPHFLFPDEPLQFHVETQLSPVPLIVPKKRVEEGRPLPEPRPLGQYRLLWRVTGLSAAEAEPPPPPGTAPPSGELDLTPDASGRAKTRLPVGLAHLEEASRSGTVCVELSLLIGDVPVEARVFRLLHSRAPWPVAVRARLNGLETAVTDAAVGGPEDVIIVLPRESEDEYRRYNPPGLRGLHGARDERILFLGDPLVEAPAGTPPDKPLGLAERLAAAVPGRTWLIHDLPGPHQGLFVYRLLAGADALMRSQPGGRLPDTALVSAGPGDAANQTPLHDFERGLDALVDRLRGAGVRRIILLGVVPEAARAAHAEAYQERCADLVRMHHLEMLDLYTAWTREPDGSRRFQLDPRNPSAAYGPTPNAEALDEIVRLLKPRLR